MNPEVAITVTAKGQMNWTGSFVEPTALDEQNKYLRTDGCVGTITTDGSSPKHNNRIIESTHTESDADQDG